MSNRFDRKTLRSFVFYEYLHGKSFDEAYENFRKVVGDDVITLTEFALWFLQFSSGNMDTDFEIKSEIPEENVEDEEPRPSKIQKLDEPPLEVKAEPVEAVNESIKEKNQENSLKTQAVKNPVACKARETCEEHLCHLCGFCLRGGLRMHVVLMHCDLKYLKCKECDYQDKNKSVMKRHTTSQHGRDIPPDDITDDKMRAEWKEIMEKCFPNKKEKETSDYIACELCETRLKICPDSFGNLKRHALAAHCARKQFKCKDCDYVDSRKETVRRHLISKHGNNVSPEDLIDDKMKAEWNGILAKCFPDLVGRTKFR